VGIDRAWSTAGIATDRFGWDGGAPARRRIDFLSTNGKYRRQKSNPIATVEALRWMSEGLIEPFAPMIDEATLAVAETRT
jgi:hypothetical protein